MKAEDRYVAGNPSRNGTDMLIVISGCSGGGKSTLLGELERLGYSVQPEVGRQIVKEQLYIGGDALPWDDARAFIELCASRSMYQFNAAAPAERAAVFDRSLVDNVTAFEQLGVPVPSPLKRALERYRYARRVFLAPPWREIFREDAERRHSFDDARREYDRLTAAYESLGYEVVILPRTGVAERADFFEANRSGG